jgi:hypothetical protein
VKTLLRVSAWCPHQVRSDKAQGHQHASHMGPLLKSTARQRK